jgi:anti-sigma B factor antagonist
VDDLYEPGRQIAYSPPDEGPGNDLRQDTLLFSVVSPSPSDRQTTVVSVRGEIDLGTAPGLREVLLPRIERCNGPVVIDLSQVRFMDSSGVHVLVDIYQRLEAHNRRLAVVCREHGQVHRLLALVGLLDLLIVRHSRASALSGVTAPAHRSGVHRLRPWATE